MGKNRDPGKPFQRDSYLKNLTLHAFGQRKKIWQEKRRKMEGREGHFSLLKWELSCWLLDHADCLLILWDF